MDLTNDGMKTLLLLYAILLFISCEENRSADTQQEDYHAGTQDAKRSSYSIDEIQKSLQRQYPQAIIRNPAKVDGNWIVSGRGSLMGSGQTFSRRQGHLEWKKISVSHESKNYVLPIILSRSTGETAYLLVEATPDIWTGQTKD